jgi:hypothetical protein
MAGVTESLVDDVTIDWAPGRYPGGTLSTNLPFV